MFLRRSAYRSSPHQLAIASWQNAWIESFNERMRDEQQNGEVFDSLVEAQVFTEGWRIDYNNRPHSAHGWLTPVEFVDAWPHRQQQPQLAWRVDHLLGSGHNLIPWTGRSSEPYLPQTERVLFDQPPTANSEQAGEKHDGGRIAHDPPAVDTPHRQ